MRTPGRAFTFKEIRMNTEINKYQLGQSNEVTARNHIDTNGNPAGGYAHGVGMSIVWQDGPRGKIGETLAPANGAFVEDALVAARQRLEFFQESQFAHHANAEAIECIDAAIKSLQERSEERRSRGVLGVNAV